MKFKVGDIIELYGNLWLVLRFDVREDFYILSNLSAGRTYTYGCPLRFLDKNGTLLSNILRFSI